MLSDRHSNITAFAMRRYKKTNKRASTSRLCQVQWLWQIVTTTLLWVFIVGKSAGQTGFSALHGNIGNSSYTSGQVFYRQFAASLAVSEGVEQGYLISTQIVDEYCEGYPYLNFGFEYGDTLLPGEYHMQRYFHAASLHYDSVVNLTLQVHPRWVTSDTLLAHVGEIPESLTGLHVDTLHSQYGCDSIVARMTYTVTCPDDYNDTAAYGVENVPLVLTSPQLTPSASELVVFSDAPATLTVGTLQTIHWSVATSSDTLLCTQNAVVHFPPCGDDLSVMDRDSNVYATIRVGANCWMKDNLRSTHYPDGDSIAIALVYIDGADTLFNWESYGRLYSWYSAVNLPEGSIASPSTNADGEVQGACPAGWHLPTLAEMSSVSLFAAHELKTPEEWLVPGDNSSGFSGMPGGYYAASTTSFESLRTLGRWWIAAEENSSRAMMGNLPNLCSDMEIKISPKRNGLSIRCIKD